MGDVEDVLLPSLRAQEITNLARSLADDFIAAIDSRSAVNALFRAIRGIVIGSLATELLPADKDDVTSSLSDEHLRFYHFLNAGRRTGPRERWNELVRSIPGHDADAEAFPGRDVLVESDGARLLIAATKSAARELAEAVDPQDEDIYVPLLALHSAVYASLCKLATIWNGNHDRSLVLPPELRVRCFIWMPTWSKCKLCLVSSHWRDTLISSPGLWAAFDGRRVPIDDLNVSLDAFISRSGVLPLDIFDLTVVRGSDILRVDRCLRACAPRLRRLAISVPLRLEESPVLFMYAAPRLEDLTLSATDIEDGWGLQHMPHLFDGCAPRLRSVDLTVHELPPECPALANVTSATIRSCIDDVSNLFAIMPVLQHLRLIKCNIWTRAALPSSHTLTAVEIDGYVHDIPMLDELGYTKVSTFTLSTSWDAERLHEAFSLSQEAPHCLEVGAHGALMFVLRLAGGGTLRCVVRDCNAGGIRRVLRDSRATAGIQMLVISREADINEEFQTVPRLSLVLPGLHTLVVQCGPTRLPELVRRRILRHPIRAPTLTRVELVPAAQLDGHVAPVDVACILSFLADDIELDNRAGLEVFVDTARGVRLEGAVELLRQAVSKLTI